MLGFHAVMDTHDDLSNDFGLAEGLEEEGEGSADEEDERGLHYQQWEGIVERVVPLPCTVR